MKNKIVFIFLLISLVYNLLQVKENTNLNIKNIDLSRKLSINVNKYILEKNKINRDCYYMYVDYYINSEGLDFNNSITKNCLLENIFKEGYNLNGVNNKILLDFLSNKDTISLQLLNKYIKELKLRYEKKVLTKNNDSMLVALSIINDKDFTKELIIKSLDGVNKELFIPYMRKYKELFGKEKILLNFLEKIKGKLLDYNYYGEYAELLKEFS